MDKFSLKRSLPFWLRVEGLRVLRTIQDLSTAPRLQIEKSGNNSFPYLLFQAQSPLKRPNYQGDPKLQRGKERNVALAARAIDGVVIQPEGLFSYHKLVGRPSLLRGFRKGLELHDGEKQGGVGGGCCMVSNMLYWLALNSGLQIVERHRHGLDLFPDCDRRVPFGCGATVFYNYRDLRFENKLPDKLQIRMRIENGELTGSIFSVFPARYKIQIEERDHRFFEENGQKMRENRIWRIIHDLEGKKIQEELIAHNRCQVMY